MAMAFPCRMIARVIGSLRGRASRRSGCAGPLVSFAFGKVFGCSVIEVLAGACREWTVVSARLFSFCLESDTVLSHVYVYECMQDCVHAYARGHSLCGNSCCRFKCFSNIGFPRIERRNEKAFLITELSAFRAVEGQGTLVLSRGWSANGHFLPRTSRQCLRGILQSFCRTQS